MKSTGFLQSSEMHPQEFLSSRSKLQEEKQCHHSHGFSSQSLAPPLRTIRCAFFEFEFMSTGTYSHTIDSLDGRFMLSRPVTDGFSSESLWDLGSRSTTLWFVWRHSLYRRQWYLRDTCNRRVWKEVWSITLPKHERPKRSNGALCFILYIKLHVFIFMYDWLKKKKHPSMQSAISHSNRQSASKQLQQPLFIWPSVNTSKQDLISETFGLAGSYT